MEILITILAILLLLLTPLGRGIIYLLGWAVGVLAWVAIIGAVALLIVGLAQ